jgi:hypothetical protein
MMNTKRAAKVLKPASKRATSKSLTGGMTEHEAMQLVLNVQKKLRSRKETPRSKTGLTHLGKGIADEGILTSSLPDDKGGDAGKVLSKWNKAALSTGQADPFCCLPSWQLSFHDAYSPKRRLLIKECSNNVIAFAEKVFSPESIYLTPIEPLWFFGNPLLGRHSLDLFSDTLVDIEKFYSPIFPRIVISGIRPNGSLYRNLKEQFDKKFEIIRHSSGIQCASSLERGLDGFLSRRSSNHRRNLKKQGKRVLGNGVSFERHVPASDQEAAEVFSRMISVELASWKGIGRCGMAEPGSKKFYRIMMRRLAFSKDARVIFAKHEGKDIGFIFGGMAGATYRGQQFSYDEEWRSASIGNMMQLETIKWLCEEGAKRYDMGPLLGYGMGYKSHWTERKRRIETWTLERK